MKREDLAAFGEDLYPDVAAMCAERQQLFLLTAQRMVAGSTTDPHALNWARHVVGTVKPLVRELSDGVPQA